MIHGKGNWRSVRWNPHTALPLKWLYFIFTFLWSIWNYIIHILYMYILTDSVIAVVVKVKCQFEMSGGTVATLRFFYFHQTFDNIKILLTWNTILRLYSIFSIVIFDFISKLVEWLVWVPISTTVLHHTSTDYIGAKNRNLLMPLLHLSPEITFKFTILPARNIKTLHQKVNKL